MERIPPTQPRCKTRLVHVATEPRDLAKTLRRELGPLGLAHLARAIAELGDTKPETLVARAGFNSIWRPI